MCDRPDEGSSEKKNYYWCFDNLSRIHIRSHLYGAQFSHGCSGIRIYVNYFWRLFGVCAGLICILKSFTVSSNQKLQTSHHYKSLFKFLLCHKAIIVKVFFILAGRSRRVRDAKEKLGHQTFIILCSELILEMCDRQSQRILFAVQRLNASRGHKMQTYSELKG